MFGKLFTLCIFLIVTPTVLSQSCGECMDNFVACINTTSYRLCFEATTGDPLDDDIYNCGANEFCTDSENVCESAPDGVNIISVCDESSQNSGCNSCTGRTNGAIICASSTQFAMCRTNGNTISPTKPLSCNSEQFCSEVLATRYNLKKVCAPQAVLDYLEVEQSCPNVGEVIPSTTSTTPRPAADVSANCRDANQTGSYFQIPNPNDCSSYIYCERNSSGGFLALDMQCKTGQFYSAAQKRCIPATRCPN